MKYFNWVLGRWDCNINSCLFISQLFFVYCKILFLRLAFYRNPTHPQTLICFSSFQSFHRRRFDNGHEWPTKTDITENSNLTEKTPTNPPIDVGVTRRPNFRPFSPEPQNTERNEEEEATSITCLSPDRSETPTKNTEKKIENKIESHPNIELNKVDNEPSTPPPPESSMTSFSSPQSSNSDILTPTESNFCSSLNKIGVSNDSAFSTSSSNNKIGFSNESNFFSSNKVGHSSGMMIPPGLLYPASMLYMSQYMNPYLQVRLG